ncbi:MAG: carotenoid oxygenase family protein, partial [Halobacteriales archaeon]|nr:carotenoid oxygenase family protein [Halobacteriales archaeon]
MPHGFELGFTSVEDEYADHQLRVDGEVPGWLDGDLYRNGPGRFEVGSGRVEHWFDGLAMLSRYDFHDGAVSYSNRFLRSREYRSVVDEGRMDGGQFGTSRGGFLGKLRRRLLPAPTDNANVNVHRLGDRLVAITETHVGVAFDPRTLRTLGQVTFDGLDGQTMTAHPHVDPRTGETVTFATSFGRHCQYGFYRRLPDALRFQAIGSVATDRPSYVHSFGMTRDYVVLFEFPLSVHPLGLLVPSSASFIERFKWRPERGTRIVVLDRERGERVIEHRVPPTFAFHHVNAFEEEGILRVDIATFDGPDIIDALYLDDLREGGFPELDGALRRYHVPTVPGEVSVESLYPDAITLPRIDPRRNTR